MGVVGSLMSSLTFPQLIIIILLLAFVLGGLGYFIFRIMIRNNYTVTIDSSGKKIKVSKRDSLNAMLLFEALKIKDDIHRVEELAHAMIKKRVKEKLPNIQRVHLDMFKKLICPECDSSMLSPGAVSMLSNHDFLYYSLLLEKAYSSSFSTIMNAIEENGLNKKENIHNYVTQKAEALFRESKHTVDSLYAGILNVDKSEHDIELLRIKPELVNIYASIFQDAITITKREYEKKEKLKTTLFEKIRSIDGMSHYQLENLFTEIDSDNFLGVD